MRKGLFHADFEEGSSCAVRGPLGKELWAAAGSWEGLLLLASKKTSPHKEMNSANNLNESARFPGKSIKI